MEYQKIINQLDNKPSQPNKYRTKKMGRNKLWIARNV